MPGHNALKLSVFIDIYSLYLWLQVGGQWSYAFRSSNSQQNRGRKRNAVMNVFCKLNRSNMTTKANCVLWIPVVHKKMNEKHSKVVCKNIKQLFWSADQDSVHWIYLIRCRNFFLKIFIYTLHNVLWSCWTNYVEFVYAFS